MSTIDTNNDGRVTPKRLVEDHIKLRLKPVNGVNLQVARIHMKDHVYLFKQTHHCVTGGGVDQVILNVPVLFISQTVSHNHHL